MFIFRVLPIVIAYFGCQNNERCNASLLKVKFLLTLMDDLAPHTQFHSMIQQFFRLPLHTEPAEWETFEVWHRSSCVGITKKNNRNTVIICNQFLAFFHEI